MSSAPVEPEKPATPQQDGRAGCRTRRAAIVLCVIAALLDVMALSCLGFAWLGDGDWIHGHGVEAYNRLIGLFFVTLPLIVAAILGLVAAVLFRRK